MDIQEAIRKVEVIHAQGVTEKRGRVEAESLAEKPALLAAFKSLGLNIDPKYHAWFLYGSGKVYVYTGRVERGLLPCPFCGDTTGMGRIIVLHEDGRTATFSPALYHYADAGHPITNEDVDIETLAAIMEDA